MKLKRILLWVFIVTFILTGFVLSSEWNRAAFGSDGYIENGKKFGVEIGATRQSAMSYLSSQGLIDVSTLNLVQVVGDDQQTCHGHKYDNDVKVDLMWDRSWRQGMICLASKSDVIIRMSWNYNMLQP